MIISDRLRRYTLRHVTFVPQLQAPHACVGFKCSKIRQKITRVQLNNEKPTAAANSAAAHLQSKEWDCSIASTGQTLFRWHQVVKGSTAMPFEAAIRATSLVTACTLQDSSMSPAHPCGHFCQQTSSLDSNPVH
jgi:hypothetical protein